MTDPVGSRTLRARVTQLERGAAKVRRLEADLTAARSSLDSLLSDAHQLGVSIAELARRTGLSRQSIYAAIDRHRSAP